MIKHLFACLFLLTLTTSFVCSQEQEDKFKSSISGIIWTQYYYDTYKNVETRDGLLLLYPVQADSSGVSEKGKLGSSVFFSRLRVKFAGSEAFGANVTGALEGDFFGTTQDNIAHFRLRHAFVKLNWDKASVLMGQYWHPILCTDAIPTADLIANVPYFPLNRSPQLSFEYRPTDQITLTAAALVHSYHRSSGDADMQRNSGIPELSGKIKYKAEAFVVGVNGGIKTLQPRLTTESGAITNKTISTPYISAFGRINTKPVTIMAQVTSGQNLTHFVMIGGFGAKGDTTGVDDYDYTALKTLSSWLDAHTNGEKVQFGLFFGYSKMNGANDVYTTIETLTRTENLSSTMRLAPRVDFLANRMKLGFEYVYSSAIYANTYDEKHVALTEQDPVASSRILVNLQFNF